MKKTVCLILLSLVLADSARVDSRQKSIRKESRSKFARSRLNRGESVENLFNVYDPSFLAVVWPKISNGVHLLLNRPCWEDVGELYKDLSDGRAWAYSAVDASGRYEGGLLEGNRFWLGSKKQCLQLDSNYLAREGNDTVDEFQNDDYLNVILRREKHFDGGAEEWRSLLQRDELMQRLVAADHAPPHRLAYTAVQLLLNLTKVTMAESYDITLGVCLPRSCTADDISSIINFSIMLNDNFKSNKTIPRVVKITELRQVDDYYDIKTDTGAILLICVTIILIIITVTATMVEFKLIKCRPHNNKSMSFDLQKFNNTFDNENKGSHDNRRHTCNTLTRKESNVVDMETLTINNINNSNNINLLTVKKVTKPNAMPPSITLDVVSMERVSGSCKRCGKYKKQCNNNPRQMDNLPACPRVKSFASLTEQKRETNLTKSLLLCFSLNYSWKRIFNTNMANKDLSMIHALKIIATFWIIFVHVAMIASFVSENGGDINEYNNAYYILATGTLAFDTLFFVSGLFSAHHFFYLKSQYTVEELVSFGGTCGQILQFVCFVTNRAIRLLPSYAFAILLTAVLSRASSRTSPLALPEGDDHNCDAYWWRNLLYATTVFPRKEQCMQVSWYMSVETQLHVAGALACAAAGAGRAGRRAAAAVAAAALLAATAADVSAAYADRDKRMSGVYALYAALVARPLARVAPYFLGVLAGWLLHRMDGRLDISKTRASFLWVVCALALAWSLWLPRAARAWALSWLHAAWPAALLWPALFFATNAAGATRFAAGSCGVAALSRLSYSMLLLHGAVARALLLATGTALCSQTVCIWVYFAGASALTVLAALGLSLLVETPCCTLLRRLSDYAA